MSATSPSCLEPECESPNKTCIRGAANKAQDAGQKLPDLPFRTVHRCILRVSPCRDMHPLAISSLRPEFRVPHSTFPILNVPDCPVGTKSSEGYSGYCLAVCWVASETYPKWLKSLRAERREGDSNPRYGFPHTCFPGMLLQPLGHLSGRGYDVRGGGGRQAMHTMVARGLSAVSRRWRDAGSPRLPWRFSPPL